MHLHTGIYVIFVFSPLHPAYTLKPLPLPLNPRRSTPGSTLPSRQSSWRQAWQGQVRGLGGGGRV